MTTGVHVIHADVGLGTTGVSFRSRLGLLVAISYADAGGVYCI